MIGTPPDEQGPQVLPDMGSGLENVIHTKTGVLYNFCLIKISPNCTIEAAEQP
jgi:hypothetical protein